MVHSPAPTSVPNAGTDALATSGVTDAAVAPGAGTDPLTPNGGLPAPAFAALPHARWNERTRGESEIQRLDRNYLELLQELRVAQTGVQILFAFLLGIGFTARFADLLAWQRLIYGVVLVLCALAAVTLIAPVVYHRVCFRQRLKRRIVQVTHVAALTGLTLLLLSLIGALNLALSFVVGGWSLALAAALGGLFFGIWYGVPLRDRLRHRRPAEARRPVEKRS